MDSSRTAWGLLLVALGSYEGRGMNHEREGFRSELTLSTKIPDKILALQFSAIGNHGEVFHQEMSWIGRDEQGRLSLWMASNNHAWVIKHNFDRIEASAECHSVIFRVGDFQDQAQFREEISLCVFTDGQLAHHFAWGTPGEQFKARSGSKLKKRRVETQAPQSYMA